MPPKLASIEELAAAASPLRITVCVTVYSYRNQNRNSIRLSSEYFISSLESSRRAVPKPKISLHSVSAPPNLPDIPSKRRTTLLVERGPVFGAEPFVEAEGMGIVVSISILSARRLHFHRTQRSN